jgi:prepilin-type N-terminal cleavage/methylation domain-containing protein
MRLVRRLCSEQPGFSLVETLIAIAILGSGLLAIATAMSQGMILMTTAHYHQIAKEKAAEAMESVFTSRDAGRFPSWNSIQNVSHGGIFLDGAKSMHVAGADGLVNTGDDGTAIESDPGNNGIPGDTDDIFLTNYTREIKIDNVVGSSNLRTITVTITYTTGSANRRYQLTAFISPFA